MEGFVKKKHFVLVHGACHGAWCWYKLKTLLELEGYRVTALDLAGSGIDMSKVPQEITTLSEYSQPLLEFMESIPAKEKVILVGHSLGGMNLAVAMEKFPHKISVSVFLTAFMPDCSHQPSYVMEKFFEETPKEEFLDTEFTFEHSSGQKQLMSTIFFGPNYLAYKCYQRSPVEDLTLAMMLTRVGPMMGKGLCNEACKFTSERYGSVARVYLVCKEDKVIPPHFQRWMIDNYSVDEVKEIEGADHMPMFSTSKQLCDALSEIALTYP